MTAGKGFMSQLAGVSLCQPIRVGGGYAVTRPGIVSPFSSFLT